MGLQMEAVLSIQERWLDMPVFGLTTDTYSLLSSSNHLPQSVGLEQKVSQGLLASPAQLQKRGGQEGNGKY